MSEEFMNAGVLSSVDAAKPGVDSLDGISPDATVVDTSGLAENEDLQAESAAQRQAEWNPDEFAREQIRGLVRRVFFSGTERPVRQVVFSAVEPETDVHRICRRVGETLALETQGTVAIAGGLPKLLHSRVTGNLMPENRDGARRLRQTANQVRRNLWLVPAHTREGEPVTAASLHQYLSHVRREFEYSVVEGRAAAESNEAMAMAQFADGLILVLSAQNTRRATARTIKEAIEGSRARLIGTVLSDRAFPIPDALYRRL
jgi:hypothetical protein